MQNHSGPYRLVGLMSGSSLDGIDLASCYFGFDENHHLCDWGIEQTQSIHFTKDWRSRLSSLDQSTAAEIWEADFAFGQYLGRMILPFLDKLERPPHAIASHGHTILHDPKAGFTVQIGHGAAIAAQTGLTVIDQFRALDIANGGQGAPIAPIADKWLFGQYSYCLNLGGIANITCHLNQQYIAFDIAGANQILNALVNAIGLPYDDKGNIAKTGHLVEVLLQKQMELSYFQAQPPKSLSNQWVWNAQVLPFVNSEAPLEDKLNTATELIARQIRMSILSATTHCPEYRVGHSVMVSGGGAFNDFLMERISYWLSQTPLQLKIVKPSDTIIEFKEAIFMALMGALKLIGQPNCLMSVTGARQNVSGGVIHNY